jgi:hypothetical protein
MWESSTYHIPKEIYIMAKYRITARDDGSVEVTAKYHPRGGRAHTFRIVGATRKDLKACVEEAGRFVLSHRPKELMDDTGLQKLTGGK